MEEVLPTCLEIPLLADLIVTKNKENWFELPEDMDEDGPEYTRTIVRLKTCPFTPCKHPDTGAQCNSCSKASWNAANVWSIHTHYHVLGYLLQHATHSRWHEHSEDEAYDMIIDRWQDLEWEYKDDTYEDRQQYRAHVEDLEQSRGKGSQKGKKGKKRKPAPVAADVVQDDTASEVPSSAGAEYHHVSREEIHEIVMQTLAAREQAANGAESSSSSSSSTAWSRIQPRHRPSVAAPKQLGDFTRGAGGAQTISLGPHEVSIPLEKLKLLQDALQRAEHAISSSLSFTVDQSNKLAHERVIVKSAIDVVSGISGVQTQHFSGFSPV